MGRTSRTKPRPERLTQKRLDALLWESIHRLCRQTTAERYDFDTYSYRTIVTWVNQYGGTCSGHDGGPTRPTRIVDPGASSPAAPQPKQPSRPISAHERKAKQAAARTAENQKKRGQSSPPRPRDRRRKTAA